MNRIALSLISLAAAVEAQTVTLTTLAPISITATHGLLSQTSTMPAGPVNLSSPLVATVTPGLGEIAHGSLGWGVVATPTHVDVVFGQLATFGSLGNAGSVHLGPTDWVIELTNPQMMFAKIEVQQEGPVPSGPNQQMFVMDSGDNGSNEYSLGSSTTPAFVSLGPTPWRIRVRTDTTLLGPGVVAPKARLVVTPMPGITTAPAVLGCDSSRWLSAAPTFTADLRFEVGFNGSGAPFVLVLGLSAQPIVIGTVPPLPCLLMPSPDLLVFIPDWSPEYVLPLPQSLRPVSFFGQAVSLEPAGLVTTNGFFVTAG